LVRRDGGHGLSTSARGWREWQSRVCETSPDLPFTVRGHAGENSIAGGGRRTPARIPTCFLWIVRLWAWRCQGGSMRLYPCWVGLAWRFGRDDGNFATVQGVGGYIPRITWE